MAEAKSIISILRVKTDDRLEEADCLYLLAHILIYEGTNDKAVVLFKEAIEIYNDHNKYEYLFYSNLGLATSYLNLSDTINAEIYLNESLRYHEIRTTDGKFTLDGTSLTKKQKVGLAQYYTLRKKFELLNGDLEKSLINAENSLMLYESLDNRSGQASILSDLGFIHMMMDNPSIGLEYTHRASSIIFEIQDKRKMVYNNLNILAYNRCHGLTYDHLYHEIQSWIVQYHDKQLDEYLERVLNTECN